MEIHVWEAERHVQVDDFCAGLPEDCSRLWDELRFQYEGFVVDFCFHNCEIPSAFMREIGASLLESCVETRLSRESFTPVYGFEAEPVSDGDLAAFAAMHDRAHPEMYWTGEKISRDPGRWRIYMREEAYVMMSLWGDAAEIFALEAANAGERAALLSMAAAYAFQTGKTGVLMMVDDGAPEQAEAARSVGFAECGKYAACRGIIK